jgi:hypothetical protein
MVHLPGCKYVLAVAFLSLFGSSTGISLTVVVATSGGKSTCTDRSWVGAAGSETQDTLTLLCALLREAYAGHGTGPII